VLIHEPCGHAVHPVLTCPHCRGEVTTGNVRSVPAQGGIEGKPPGIQRRAGICLTACANAAAGTWWHSSATISRIIR
jgi:hypothetical protein